MRAINIKSFLGIFLSLIIFGYLMLNNLGFSNDQVLFISIFFFVVYYWLFSQIPLFITGFFGVSLSILMGLAPAKLIFSSFGHPIIFLFLGGFIIAEAFKQVGLDRRLSLYFLSQKIVAKSFSRFLFALLFLTAFFSMWISNTATTAMMLPLVLGLLKSLDIKSKKATSLILISVAYASSIGGIATPVGSTPNIISLGMLEETIGLKIGFLEWITYALPISLSFLFILFIIVRSQIKTDSFKINTDFIKKEYKSLTAFSTKEKITFFIFILTVLLWMLPSLAKLFFQIDLKLNPGASVMFTSALLFILGGNDKVLKSSAIKNIDWSSLLLFGCGLALGKLLFDLGLAKMAGDQLTTLIKDLPLFLVYLVAFTFVIFATELTSNTATATILLPIMTSLALSLELNPFYFSLGISLACSLAFMLPVATPPNAIVYGSGLVEKRDMFKLGLGLNIIFSISLALFIFLFERFL